MSKPISGASAREQLHKENRDGRKSVPGKSSLPDKTDGLGQAIRRPWAVYGNTQYTVRFLWVAAYVYSLCIKENKLHTLQLSGAVAARMSGLVKAFRALLNQFRLSGCW